ncbi:2-dehydropantoate 2-reductase [uncultured Parabacteroides sp.]|uniref:ketopantoate reductase family protein n=1 Tax=uncultured Parabacteroides sp. TaxID=512312 RepID=UPI0026387692|nr:2-dehydropantoate 2-reductase [uncultured Parabacteroides sp.]
MSKTKIAISGIGAVGGYYGGLLAARYKDSDKVDIYFISRGENLKEIRENGIEVRNTFLTIKAKPTLTTDNPAEIGPVDYLFCCTKSYDLEENIAQLAPVIGPNTVIIPLLNGADIAERIQKLLPDNEVWKGCVYIGSRLVRPGKVEKFTIKDRMFFGSKDAQTSTGGSRTVPTKRQKELQDILANARILTTIPADIDVEIWKKFFMISTAATITSYFNEPISEVINNHIDLYITLGYELKSVAVAKGIPLPDDQVFSAIDAQKIMPNNSTTSMHSDFLKGNRTEVETLTGYVIRTAQELGIEVPTYQFMYKGLTEFPYPVAD